MPIMSDLKTTMANMTNNKAAGLDGIPAEIYKYDDELMIYSLVFQHFWECGELPQDFKDALIITIFRKSITVRTVVITVGFLSSQLLVRSSARSCSSASIHPLGPYSVQSVGAA